jgi:hypothetical protein
MRRTTTVDTDEQDDPSSLYDIIVNASGLEYNPAKSDVEDYKNGLVRFFGKMDFDEFDRLPLVLRDWVNEATLVFNANRRTKEERSPLPDIEGLPEEEDEEPAPPPARRARVAVDDDDDEVAPPPPPARSRRVAPVPVDDDDDDDDDDDEVAPAPPPRTTRTRRGVTTAPAPAPAAPAGRSKRDPDSGRYAKVMPHYLKYRNIEVPELQKRIEKTDGANYSETTLDRTLAACQAVVGWAERNGVDFSPALRK